MPDTSRPILSAEPISPDWRIKPGVHAARVDGDLVFLNARANHYSCLPRSIAVPVAELLAGLRDDADPETMTELESEGLVTKGEGHLLPAPIAHAAHADFHDLALETTPLRLRLLASFALAALVGAWRLAFTRPASWLRPRRKRPTNSALSRICLLAAQFDRLRPLIPRSGGCVAHSMLLLSFLRLHGVDADWIFGVQTFPFDAHCWVEHDGVVLSDTLDHVRWFTPIAVA